MEKLKVKWQKLSKKKKWAVLLLLLLLGATTAAGTYAFMPNPPLSESEYTERVEELANEGKKSLNVLANSTPDLPEVQPTGHSDNGQNKNNGVGNQKSDVPQGNNGNQGDTPNNGKDQNDTKDKEDKGTGGQGNDDKDDTGTITPVDPGEDFPVWCDETYARIVRVVGNDLKQLVKEFETIRAESDPTTFMEHYGSYVLYFETLNTQADQLLALANTIKSEDIPQSLILIDQMIETQRTIGAITFQTVEEEVNED